MFIICEFIVLFSAYYFSCAAAQEACSDLRGRVISHGLHYVPGPDTCTLCICDNGTPKVCKAVLCSPPQDCRSFRVGNTCCEFICLDDVVKPEGGSEGQVRAAAGGAGGAVLLAAALLLYRVRRRKLRHHPHPDDQRSLTSIGYISGSMGYMGGSMEPGLSAWKPLGAYLPRGEAPPPYDEVMAQCRPDIIRMSETTFHHRTLPSTLDTQLRPEEVQCIPHGYINLQRPAQQIANTQNCYNAPLLQSVPDQRDINHGQHHLNDENRMCSAGSLEERPHNVPGFYAHTAPLMPLANTHRTIPRISPGGSLGRGRGRTLVEVRRSFHKPAPAPHQPALPTHLDLAAPTSAPAPERPLAARVQPEAPSLPLTVDKPSCDCSYEGEAPDADDYRAECENCKASTGSKWSVQENEWDAETSPRTQTLQRAPAPPAPPAQPPATATLPQPVTKHSRSVLGQPSNWENWFNTIPDSDSESEEE